MLAAFRLAISLLLPYAAAAIGNLATIPNIPSWYAALEKPLLNPPNFVFGPVWTVLYVLMGISLFLVWNSGGAVKQRAYIAFGVQLVLNTLWSIVFFGLHQPWIAAFVIVALIVAIVATIVTFRRYSMIAVWLLVPYLAWVCFATYLNIGIALLN